jgi:Flp pilus assembly protein TadD
LVRGDNPASTGDLVLAEALMRLKRTSEAENVLEKSLGAEPDGRVALSLSKIAFASRDTKKGITVLASWVSRNPNDSEKRRECAGYQIATGDLAGARKNYEVLVKQHPHDPIVLNNLGWLVQKHDPNRALAMLTLANKIAPQSANFADTLGWLKYQRKDHQGALPLLQRAHDIDTTSAPISYPLALALDATGKRPRRNRCCSPPWRKIQI